MKSSPLPPLPSPFARWFALALVLIGALSASQAAHAAPCDATATLTPTTTTQWRRWETTLTANNNYLTEGGVPNKGNPYRDLELRVTYTNCTTGEQFSTFGFWNGGQQFKIRGAFAPPTSTSTSWDYQWTTTCNRRAGAPTGPDCSFDLQRKGRIRVSKAAGHHLYTKGFLKTNGRTLVYDNGERFFWLGDTAWTLSVANNPNYSQLFASRGAVQGALPAFTAVQISPAPQWGGVRAAFENSAGCSLTTPQPNDCSRWLPSFWDGFDAIVESANQNGLVAAVLGVMEPLNEGTYPSELNAGIFARNLVARLYGNFVTYSPGFDSPVVTTLGTATNPRPGQLALIRAVGQKINEATTRHLIGNHNAGQTPTSDLEVIHNDAWLDFQHYQSGKAGQAISGITYPSTITNNTQRQLFNMTYRAAQMPRTLYRKATPRPSVNGETAYDKYTLSAHYAPARIRQTAYLSLLNGSVGYTYGNCWIMRWGTENQTDCPWSGSTAAATLTNELTSPASKQTRILRKNFESISTWYNLQPEFERVVQASTTPPELTVALARDASTNTPVIAAYLPQGVANAEINFGAVGSLAQVAGLAGKTCWPDNWTVSWLSPRTGNLKSAATPTNTASGRFRFTKPTCDGGCDADDWMLRIVRTRTTGTCPVGAALQAWIAPLDTDVNPVVAVGPISGQEGEVEAGFLTTAKLRAEGGSPQVATGPSGDSLVVWQTSGTDGSPRIVYQGFDSAGLPLSEETDVAPSFAGHHTHPTVANLPNGNFLITWAWKSSAIESSSIFELILSSKGEAISPPFSLTCQYYGDFPQVVADPVSGALVAWLDPSGTAIYGLRVGDFGEPIGFETAIVTGSGPLALAAIEPGSDGFASIVWEGLSVDNPTPVGGEVIETDWFPTGWTCW